MSHNKTPPSLFGHIAELGRTVSGNDLDVAAQKFLVLGRDILEAHANSESWRSARNLALQSQLGFSQPQCDFEFGVHPQRNGHFYEAAAQAQIRNLAPYHWLSHRVQFRSDGALRPGGLAPVLVCKAKVVNHPGRQRKVPERLFWGQIEQSNLAVLRRSRLTRPLHPKVDLVLSIRRSDDFVHFDLGSDATQLRAVLTNIDRGHILGEYLASGVSPKNADPHVDWFSRFTTLAHLLKYPRLRMIMEHRPLYPASHRNKPP